MSHAAPHEKSNFNTTRFTIYMLSTATFIALLLYAIGATHFINYATNPRTGTQSASAAHHGHDAKASESHESHETAASNNIKIELPDGVSLDAEKGSIEAELIVFIEDKNAPVDKNKWFDFDDLLFETGKSTLTAESIPELHNVAAIFKAFPKVTAKIGGYTDNTGDSLANVKLSGDRAASVMNELVKLGVEPTRLTAEGYGPQYPVGNNETEEGRALNRRISLSVREK